MPPRRTLFFIMLLAVLTVLLGWNYVLRSGKSEVALEVMPSPTPVSVATETTLDISAEAAVAEVLAVPLTVSNVTASASPSAEMAWIKQRQPGMVTLFGTRISTASASRAVAQLRAQYDTPSSVLVAVDHEGGTVQRLSGTGFTRLPNWQTLCNVNANTSTQSAQLTPTELLTQSAVELKRIGIDLVLAPVVDVGSADAVLRTRICSDDADVVIAQASNYINAFQAQNIIPTLKHFPGIGTTTRDLHFAFDRVTVSANEAIVYRQLLNQFPTLAVLISHVGVSNQFPDIPCSLSADCIAELKQNYSQVLVISDALEMDSAGFEPVTNSSSRQPKPSLSTVAIKAMLAGNEVLLFGEGVGSDELETVYQDLLREYQTSGVFQEKVKKSVQKIRTIKQQHTGTKQ